MNQFFDYNNNVFRVLGGLAEIIRVSLTDFMFFYCKLEIDGLYFET